MTMLTVALCKGKLIEPTLELFARAGYGAAKPAADSRRLVLPCPEIGMTFLIVRPTDVPTYVEYGAADVGIVPVVDQRDAFRANALHAFEIDPLWQGAETFAFMLVGTGHIPQFAEQPRIIRMLHKEWRRLGGLACLRLYPVLSDARGQRILL